MLSHNWGAYKYDRALHAEELAMPFTDEWLSHLNDQSAFHSRDAELHDLLVHDYADPIPEHDTYRRPPSKLMDILRRGY